MTQPAHTPPRPTRPREAGFTLIEMLVSMGILLAVIGTVFSLVDPSQGISKAQPEVADMQERMRVAADILQKDLLMAGAGTYSGSKSGALANFFPPIQPRRTGSPSTSCVIAPCAPADGPMTFFDDRISIAYVPDTASQTNVYLTMPNTSAEVKVFAQPGCPEHDLLCGFKEGMRVLIFDDTGTYDFFSITHVSTTADSGQLQHNNTLNAVKELSKAYSQDQNAQVAMVETHVYWLNRATAQLSHYDGSQTDLPMVDNTVQLRFRYFGDPNPPLFPKPFGTPPQATCVMDAAGHPLLPVLDSGGSSLIELTADMLTDGPECGAGENRFDADLYRIRKVRVDLRVQAGLQELRGANPTSRVLFTNPGTSHNAYTRVPDYSMSFEVAPRNMNLVR